MSPLKLLISDCAIWYISTNNTTKTRRKRRKRNNTILYGNVNELGVSTVLTISLDPVTGQIYWAAPIWILYLINLMMPWCHWNSDCVVRSPVFRKTLLSDILHHCEAPVRAVCLLCVCHNLTSTTSLFLEHRFSVSQILLAIIDDIVVACHFWLQMHADEQTMPTMSP